MNIFNRPYAADPTILSTVLAALVPVILVALVVLQIIFWYRIYMIVRYEYYKRKR